MSTVRTPNRLPPLENGDRLSRAEFERRYIAMPHIKKAELIDGEVYMDSAALVNRDLAKVLAALARGTASAEHGEFVQRLAARRKT